ncbi:hypothetical protein [Salmonella enterica]|uniref:hypothetical protein n=1 Tax=Salmonella enterica TaxID=28901 RepID=UPI0009B0329D|nr:hypothetical protein [Salmonella enterica]
MMHLKPLGVPGKCPAHLRAWSALDDKFIVDNFPQLTAKEMASRVNRSVEAVRVRIVLLRSRGEIKCYRFRPYTKDEKAFIYLHSQDMTVNEMAHHLGRTIWSLEDFIYRHRISFAKFGDHHHCCLVSDEDVSLIRELRDSDPLHPVPFREISEKFGIKVATAKQVYYYRLTADYRTAHELLPR